MKPREKSCDSLSRDLTVAAEQSEMISESQTSHCRNHTWEQRRLAVHILLSKLSKEEEGVVDSAGSAAGIPSCPKRDVKAPSTPHYRKYHFIPRKGSMDQT